MAYKSKEASHGRTNGWRQNKARQRESRKEIRNKKKKRMEKTRAFDQFSKWQPVDGLSLFLFSGTHFKCIFVPLLPFPAQFNSVQLEMGYFFSCVVQWIFPYLAWLSKYPIIFHCKIIALFPVSSLTLSPTDFAFDLQSKRQIFGFVCRSLFFLSTKFCWGERSKKRNEIGRNLKFNWKIACIANQLVCFSVIWNSNLIT